MAEITREELLEALYKQEPLAETELLPMLSDGSALMKLLGMLFQQEKAIGEISFLSLSLITEEEWRNAIAVQGKAQGRMMLLEGLIDLILGVVNNDRERTESGDGSSD